MNVVVACTDPDGQWSSRKYCTSKAVWEKTILLGHNRQRSWSQHSIFKLNLHNSSKFMATFVFFTASLCPWEGCMQSIRVQVVGKWVFAIFQLSALWCKNCSPGILETLHRFLPFFSRRPAFEKRGCSAQKNKKQGSRRVTLANKKDIPKRKVQRKREGKKI